MSDAERLARATLPPGSGASIAATRHAGLARLEPLTTNAEAWLHSITGPEASWDGDALVVELRYFPEIAEAAIAAGTAPLLITLEMLVAEAVTLVLAASPAAPVKTHLPYILPCRPIHSAVQNAPDAARQTHDRRKPLQRRRFGIGQKPPRCERIRHRADGSRRKMPGSPDARDGLRGYRLAGMGSR